MADDNSLLIRIKGDSSSAKTAVAETRAAIASLRSSAGTNFGQLSTVATSAMGKVTQSLTQVAGQTPIVGTAISSLSNNLNSLTASTTGAAGGMSALVGGSVLAAAATGALITGLISVGKAAFDLAKQAGDAGGKIFDLTQKLNFSAETLSALQVAAKTSGSDIEALAASLGIFNRNMEKSASSTKETSDVFKQFKIDTTDNEKALRQVFQLLVSLPSGAQQAALAMSFFGRSGKDVLGVLKEMGGDLDGSISKYKELGLIISGDAARAADKFSDQLDTLNLQIAGVTRQIGEQLIPLVLDVIQKLSAYLKDNKAEILAWAKSTQDAAATAIEWRNEILILTTAFAPLLQGIQLVRAAMDTWNEIPDIIKRIITEMVPLLKIMELIRDLHNSFNQKGPNGFTGTAADFFDAGGGETPQPLSGVGPSAGRSTLGDKTGGGGGKAAKVLRDEIYKAALEASKEATAKELEEQRNLSVGLKQAYDLNLVNLEDYYRSRQGLIDGNFNAEIDAINREQQALDEARARGRIKQEEANKKDAELTLRTTKAQNKLEEETNQLRIDRQKDRDRAELELNRQLAAIRIAQREREIRRFEDLADRHVTREADVVTRLLEIEAEAFAEESKLREIELEQLTTSADRKVELDNQKIKSEEEYTEKVERLIQRRVAARIREATKDEQLPSGAPGSETVPLGGDPDLIARQAGAAANRVAGIPPELSSERIIQSAALMRDAFTGLGTAISETLGLSAQAGDAIGNVLAGAFSGLAQAVGDAVHAFVLFGGAGIGIKKFTATLIAEIARMAAVQAVWELAQGLAMLALNFFWPDPKLAASASAHFHAAAVYGGLAAVAAVAGRAVAGGSFTEKGGSSSAGGGNQGRNPSDRRAVQAVEVDRNQGGGQGFNFQPKINVTITGQATEGFRYMVENVAVESVRLNGPFRKIQNGEDV